MRSPRAKGRPPAPERRSPTAAPLRLSAFNTNAAASANSSVTGKVAVLHVDGMSTGQVYDRQAVDAVVPIADIKACRDKATAYLPGGVVPPGQWRWMASDFNVKRYVVARKGNVEAAAKQMAGTVMWREARGLLDDVVHAPNHFTDSFMPIGLDRRKHVIIYSCYARADMPTSSNAEAMFDHAFQVLESACDDAQGIQRTLWVIDFNGFGLRHIVRRTVILGCNWFSQHNPERLGALVLMNPPRSFIFCYKLLLAFMDPDSATRLLVCKAGSEDAEKYFQQWCSPATAEWVTAISKIPACEASSFGLASFPPGTDFSLIEQTKWRGPPTAAVLASDASTDAFTTALEPTAAEAAAAAAEALEWSADGNSTVGAKAAKASARRARLSAAALRLAWASSLVTLAACARQGLVGWAGLAAGFAVGVTAMLFPTSSVFEHGERDRGRGGEGVDSSARMANDCGGAVTAFTGKSRSRPSGTLHRRNGRGHSRERNGENSGCGIGTGSGSGSGSSSGRGSASGCSGSVIPGSGEGGGQSASASATAAAIAATGTSSPARPLPLVIGLAICSAVVGGGAAERLADVSRSR